MKAAVHTHGGATWSGRTRFRIYIIPIRWSTKRLHYYAPVRSKSASGRSVCAVLHVSPNLRVRFVVVANEAERAG